MAVDSTDSQHGSGGRADLYFASTYELKRMAQMLAAEYLSIQFTAESSLDNCTHLFPPIKKSQKSAIAKVQDLESMTKRHRHDVGNSPATRDSHARPNQDYASSGSVGVDNQPLKGIRSREAETTSLIHSPVQEEDSVATRLGSTKKQIADLKLQLREHQEKVSDLEMTLMEARRQTDIVAARLADELEPSQTRCATLETELQGARQERVTLMERLTGNQHTIKELNSEIKTHTKDIFSLSTRCDSQDQRIGYLVAENSHLVEENTAALLELKRAQDQYESLQASMTQREREAIIMAQRQREYCTEQRPATIPGDRGGRSQGGVGRVRDKRVRGWRKTSNLVREQRK